MGLTGIEVAIERRDHGRTAVLTLGGEIEVHGAPTLREQLAEVIGEGLNLIIDLANVEYLDSTGLGVFVGILKRARCSDLEVVVVYGGNARVRSIFTITGLTRVFVFADSVDDALTLLNPTTTAPPP